MEFTSKIRHSSWNNKSTNANNKQDFLALKEELAALKTKLEKSKTNLYDLKEERDLNLHRLRVKARDLENKNTDLKEELAALKKVKQAMTNVSTTSSAECCTKKKCRKGNDCHFNVQGTCHFCHHQRVRRRCAFYFKSSRQAAFEL